MRGRSSIAANVRGLPQGGPQDTLRQASVRGSASLFSKSEIMDRLQLVKSGKMSSDEFLSMYPENMVGFIGEGVGASIVVDKSLLRSA